MFSKNKAKNEAKQNISVDKEKQYSESLLTAFLTYISLYIIFNTALDQFYFNDMISRIGNFVGLVLAILVILPLAIKVPSGFLVAPLKINLDKLKYAIKLGLLLSLIFGGIMIGGKYALQYYKPEMLIKATPFFYLDRLKPSNMTFNTMCYPLTAFWQEYCINVMGYDGFKTLLVSKHRNFKAILMTILIFGAMHYVYGFAMIILSMVFVFFMNFIYRKTKNLWVCTLMHLVLGQLLFTLQLQKIVF